MSRELMKLFPFAQNHSVAEVVVTFTLGKKIDNPQEFIKKFKPMFSDFQQTGVVFSQGIQLELNETYLPKINSNNPEIQGFFAQKLKDDNSISIVVRNYIDVLTGLPILSFHFLDYVRYNNFLDDFLIMLHKLNELELFIVQTIGFTYVDLFEWRSQENLPLSKIFNKKNKYLPEHFFSYKGDFMIVNSGVINGNNEQEYIEKIQIRSTRQSESSLNLQIIHDVILDLKKQVLLNELIENKTFSPLKETLNFEHQLNKDFLNNILSMKVKNKIKLTS